MEVTASNKPSSECLRIARNVFNELGDLKCSSLVEDDCLRLRDARVIIGRNDEVNRRRKEPLGEIFAIHQ